MTTQTFYRLTLIACLFICSANAASQDIAKTLRVEKEVTLSRQDAVENLKRGTNLRLADRVVTHENARASLRFYEGTLLTLGANTQMDIQAFSSEQQDKNAFFEFTKGAFRIITGAITQTESPNFQVRTPLGTIGIRGTDFWGGELGDDGSLHILLIDSEHGLVVENELGKVVIDRAGFGTILRPNQAPTAASEWPKAKVEKAVKTISFSDDS